MATSGILLRKMTPDNLREIESREETPEEADHRLKFASYVYDKNLATLTPHLSRKGIWRILLSDVGEVLSVSKGPKRPVHGEFCMIISGPGCTPRFGSKEHLSDMQSNIATILMKDLTTISQVKEEASRASGKGCKEVDDIICEQLSNLERRFGSLPPSRSELLLQQAELAPPSTDTLDIDQCLPSFEDLLQSEEKKREKRRRQRERRRLEAQASST